MSSDGVRDQGHHLLAHVAAVAVLQHCHQRAQRVLLQQTYIWLETQASRPFLPKDAWGD